MSDLQISLLVVGAVVVGAVYLFNWVQERKLRRRLEQAFGAERDDVLLGSAQPPMSTKQRIEPRLQPKEDLATEAHVGGAGTAGQGRPAIQATGSSVLPAVPGFDATIDFIAEIDAPAPIPGAAIGELLSRAAACGKPVRAAGFSVSTGEWEDLGRAGGTRSTSLRLALQLVDRNGPVTAPQLGLFSDAVKHCAGRAGAAAVLSDVQAALKMARELDGFCAEVDVAIGLNIVAPEGEAFAGTRIRALAEAAGFKLEPEGVFQYRDDQRGTLFTLDNHEPAPFIPEQIKSLSTTGITLLLDVPCVSDGQHALGRMIEIAKSLAEALGGRLVDDNRVALNDAGLAKIRQQLSAIHATMEARGINAGSARALRLFA